MARTKRNTRRGNASIHDWFDGTDPTRDGFGGTTPGDAFVKRDQRRKQRHADRAIIKNIMSDALDADDTVFQDNTARRTNVREWASW